MGKRRAFSQRPPAQKPNRGQYEKNEEGGQKKRKSLEAEGMVQKGKVFSLSEKENVPGHKAGKEENRGEEEYVGFFHPSRLPE